MKRAILTAAFAIGLSTLFAACGGGGGGSSNPAVVPPNQCTTPGFVPTTCGCQNPSALPANCTITNYNTGYSYGGFGGGYPGGYGGGQYGQYGFNPSFGNPGAIVPGYTTPFTVPPCAYVNRCYYYAPPTYYGGGYASGYAGYQRPNWFFYISL